MEFISTSETGQKWGLTPARVRTLAREGKIEGAKLVGNSWLIPASARRPPDGRSKLAKSTGRADSTFRFPLLLHNQCAKGAQNAPLSKDEARLLEGQTALAQGCIPEAQKKLELLLKEAVDLHVKAGALHGLCLCQIALGCPSLFSYYRKELDALMAQAPVEHRVQLELVIAELEIYYKGTDRLKQLLPSAISCDPQGELWPILAYLATYAAMSDCLMGILPPQILPYQLICNELERGGYLYASHLIHANIAVICYFAKNYKEMERHITRALEISCQNSYLFSLAVTSSYVESYLTTALPAFPAEYAEQLLKLGRTVHTGYQAIMDAMDEIHLFSTLEGTDFEYVALAVKGLTNKEIARLKGLSEVTVSKRYSAICQKLSISSKKELVKVARGTAKTYDTSL